MPELVQKILTGVLRTFLAPLLVWMVDKGWLTQADTAQLIAQVVIYAGVGLWALRDWIKAHRTQLTALAMPKGSTLDMLAEKVKAGETPRIATSADATPIITKQF